MATHNIPGGPIGDTVAKGRPQSAPRTVRIDRIGGVAYYSSIDAALTAI